MRRPCHQCVHYANMLTLCSIRQRYVNVPNVGWPTDRVLVSQISIGRRDRESLQQDRKHCQFAFFPAALSCLELGAPSECGDRAADAFTTPISLVNVPNVGWPTD